LIHNQISRIMDDDYFDCMRYVICEIPYYDIISLLTTTSKAMQTSISRYLSAELSSTRHWIVCLNFVDKEKEKEKEIENAIFKIAPFKSELRKLTIHGCACNLNWDRVVDGIGINLISLDLRSVRGHFIPGL
jgi:hypothetical protein